VADWRARMSTDDAEAIFKERAATAECAKARARNRGLTRLLVRGVEKVKSMPAGTDCPITWLALGASPPA